MVSFVLILVYLLFKNLSRKIIMNIYDIQITLNNINNLLGSNVSDSCQKELF